MAEKSLINSNLESQLENGSRQCVYSLGETSNCSQGLCLQSRPDIIISLHAQMQLWFYLSLLQCCLSCESKDFISWLVGQTSRSSRTQNLLPFLSKMVPDLLLLRAGTEFGQCPGRSEAKSGLLSSS